MFRRPFLFLTGLMAALAAAPDAQAQDTLYALDRNGPLLRDIDPTNGSTLDSGRTLSLGGVPIAGAQGCARNPLTDELLALVRNTSGSQFLVTVDETNGDCTDTGTVLPDLFSDVAFSGDGTLYGISGNIGSLNAADPGELHRWIPGSGVFQFLVTMTSVDTGNPLSARNHAIGWNPETQKLLHNSGGSGLFSGSSSTSTRRRTASKHPFRRVLDPGSLTTS
ncbi:MAG: hypothetical protein AAF368_10000 [Planctomycetota bacterium]